MLLQADDVVLAKTTPDLHLVGEINGIFQKLGLNYTGTAWSAGTLNLYYWDSNNGDNSGQVTVDVTASPTSVPEPESIALLGMGLLGLARVFGRQARASYRK